MPYGIPPERGGESLRNTLKMEACVQAVMAKGEDKVSAIRICKKQLGFTKEESDAGTVPHRPA